MTMQIREVGDNVGFPNPLGPAEKGLTVEDRQFVVYGPGKLYVRYLIDGLLERLCQEMHENIENEYDNVVVICGKEGTGKSNLAYHLCKLYDPDFDVKKGYIYEFDGFVKMLAKTKGGDRGKVFWMDEATNIASNRDWMKTDNKMFIQMLEMMRSRGWTLILCIPSIDRLDVYIREYRVKYILLCMEMQWSHDTGKRRGYAELKRPTGKGWVSVGYTRFPKIDPQEKALYESVKRGHQDAKIDEIQKKMDKESGKDRRYIKEKERVYSLVLYLKENGVRDEEIAKVANYNVDYVRQVLSKARKHRDGIDDEDET